MSQRLTDGLFTAPRWHHSLIAFAAFIVLTVAWTWPLAADPASHIRGLNDPYLFTWILGWVSSTLYTNPAELFNAPIFWPYGLTLAWSEPMILPAVVVGAPIWHISGNPILAYNVAQLLFQAFSGWCAWYVTRRITGSNTGALLAGIVFALGPFKTGYYQYLNIHLSFALPLAFMSWYRFLMDQRWRHLLTTVLLVWLQALCIWYGAIPLVLVLILLALAVMALRPGAWIKTALLRAPAGAALFGVLIAPLALPYLRTRDELGFERSLAEIIKFRADILSFFDAGQWHFLHQWIDSGREPGLMPGLTVYALALLALVALVRHAWARWSAGRGLLALGLALITLAGAAACVVLRSFGVVMPGFVLLGILAATGLLCGLAMLRHGLSRQQLPDQPQGFSHFEWTGVAAVFTLAGILLALGPVVYVNDLSVGSSPYQWLYHYFPGFKGLRISFRLAYVFLFFVGLLAALGLPVLLNRFTTPRSRRRASVLLTVTPLLVLGETLHKPLHFDTVNWDSPPAGYSWLRQQADAGEFGAVLELPTFNEDIDSTYVFWSLYHTLPVVNGVSGFPAPISAELATALRRIPATGNATALAEISQLRYLKVNLEWIRDPQLRAAWLAQAYDPANGLRFEGAFDSSLLFALVDHPARTTRWRQRIASRSLVGIDALALNVSLPSLDPAIHTTVSIDVNGKTGDPISLTELTTVVNVPLPPPLKAKPVTVTAQQSYQLAAPDKVDARHVVGTTTTRLGADLMVESAMATTGDYASIWLNGRNIAMRQIGYNVAALDSRTGKVIERAAFDLRREPSGKAMGNWLTSRAPGEVIVIALRRVGAPELPPAVLDGLRGIGARINPRDATLAHVVVGVRGAEPASAVELTGNNSIRHQIGQDRRDQAMTVEIGKLP